MRDLQFDILAKDRTQAAFRSAEQNARQFNQQIDRTQMIMGAVATAARGFLVGFAAGGIGEFGRLLKELVGDAGDFVDMAKRVGVGIEDLQRLKFGLQLVGVGAEDVDGILTQWSKRIGEAYTQGGRLYQILRANEVALTDGDGKLRSSVSLMRDYAELIRNAASDQERTFLATEAFGRSGAAMVLALKDGRSGFDDVMAAAADAGGVIRDELLSRIDEIDDRLAMVSRTMEIRFKTAVFETVVFFDEMLGHLGSIETKLGEIGNLPVWKQLGDLIGVDQDEVARINARMARDAGAPLQAEERRLRLVEQRRRIEDDIAYRAVVVEKLGHGGADAQRELADLRDQLAEVERAIARAEAAARGEHAARLERRFPGKEKDDLGIGLPGRTTVIPSGDDQPARLDRWNDLREVDGERVRVLELIASLREELRLVGATDQAKRAAAISRRAGAAATEDERRRIIDLNEALFQEQRAEREARKEREFGRDLAGGFFGDLASAGDDFWENFERAGLRVGERIAARWQERVLDQIFGTGDFAGQGGSTLVEAIFGRRAKAESGGSGGALDLGRRVFDAVAAPARDVGMSVYREAIASIESLGSGGYGAIGPTHPTLGRALGRYGVMEANVGPWSQAALGRSISVEEFMANPGLQDRIFDHRFGGYVGRYGPQGAASMWFSGRPDVPNVADSLGTTVPAYVRKFNAAVETATKNLGGFGDGLGKFGDALSKFPAAPAAYGGGYGGLIGSLFGSVGWAGSRVMNLVNSGVVNGLFADGGWPAGRVDGPGGGRDDGMLAWFSSGEFLVERRAAMEFADVLEAINGGASPREVARRAARRDPWLARHAMGGWAGRNAALQRVVDGESGGLGRPRPDGVVVTGDIGVRVEVDGEGNVRALVDRKSFEAAQAGAAMAVNRVARDLPKMQAAHRVHGGVVQW